MQGGAVNISDALANLGIEPIDLYPGDVVESAVVIVKTANAEDGAAAHRIISPSLTHWEAIGLLTDALDGMRWAGIAAED